MMNGKAARRVLVSGILGGVLLALYMKAIEAASGTPVYELLLNVRFRFLPDVHLSELQELSIHMMISIAAAAVWTIAGRFKPVSFSRFFSAVLFILPAIALYFPLSILAAEPFAWTAEGFLLWTAGHLLYVLLLSCTIPGKTKK